MNVQAAVVRAGPPAQSGPGQVVAFHDATGGSRQREHDLQRRGPLQKKVGAGMTVERETSINHPAGWGAAKVYVQQAGVTPVFWLQDARGFTLDRVAASVPRSGEPAEVPLDEERLALFVDRTQQSAVRPS